MDKETKKKQIKLSIIISLSVILIPAIIIGIVGLKQDLDKKKQIAAEEARLAAQVEVPNIIGMTANEANETLNNAHLKIKMSDYSKKQTDEKPDEYVIDTQFPSAKEKVDPNTEVEVFFKELKMVESNNFYKMRFKKTIADFCESYNKNLEFIYDSLNEDKAAIGLYKIQESDFIYYTKIEDTDCKMYMVNKIGFSIFLYIESDSDYIVYACVGYDESKVADSSKKLTFIVQKIYPALIMSLNGNTYSKTISNIERLSKEGEKTGSIYIDRNVYLVTADGTLQYFYIYAMNEDRYNTLVSKTLPVVPQSNEFYVNDTANVLNSDTEKYIIDINKELYEKTGAQIVVVTVKNLGGKSIEEYSTELFRQYEIGSKDKNNGILLILSVEDRKTRIEVGNGLETRLTNEKTGSILDDHAVPYFKDNNWNDGIRNTFDTILNEVCKEYNITINGNIEN